MPSDTRAFIIEHTRLRRPPGLPELQLHLVDEIMPLWYLVAEHGALVGAPLPFWASIWLGGQAIARYLLDGNEDIHGKRVLDFATGSGVAAIAAMAAGASSALASDIDPYCEDAVALNAQANGVHVAFTGRNLLDVDPPDVDLILAGDICYEQPMATSVLSWLRKANERGARILVGDPGRAHFPRKKLVCLAEYEFATTQEQEGVERKRTGVYTFSAPSRLRWKEKRG